MTGEEKECPRDEAPGTMIDLSFKLDPSEPRRGRPVREAARDLPLGRLPRITKLMALAIKFEGLIREGHIRDYAELARLGAVTRPRITQIMNLLHLAPDIQEEILGLPRTVRGKDRASERVVRPITGEVHWGRQREMWAGIRGDAGLA